MNILVLGISGMLGNAMFRFLSEREDFRVWGTARSDSAKKHFPAALASSIIVGVDVLDHDSLVRTFAQVKPDLVINCVGLVKQLAEANDPLSAVPLNTLLPHRLANLCQVRGARLIHISTDCVFSGSKGAYLESDFPDAYDLYGRTKLLGEVDYPGAVTLRTSIIGHELTGHKSLLCWFLAQEGKVKGYTKAIFSGLPTVELARLVKDVVIPRPDLRGLYHVAAAPIAKYDLLKIVAEIYGKKIELTPVDDVVIDRSLNAERFKAATGYEAPPWPVLIERMRAFG